MTSRHLEIVWKRLETARKHPFLVGIISKLGDFDGEPEGDTSRKTQGVTTKEDLLVPLLESLGLRGGPILAVTRKTHGDSLGVGHWVPTSWPSTRHGLHGGRP